MSSDCRRVIGMFTLGTAAEAVAAGNTKLQLGAIVTSVYSIFANDYICYMI